MSAREHYIRVTKRARYYSLGDSAAASDVWIVCHGYGQLAGKFIEQFNCIAASNRVIMAPEALHRFYIDPPPAPAAQRRVGATWMTREDRESDIADYVDYLDTLVSEVLSQAPTARLRMLGFSQGSAAMLRWAIRGVRVPQHLIIWAGEVPTDVDWNMGARKLASSRIDVVRGNHDELTSHATLERNLRTLTEVGLSYELHQFNGRHHLDDPTLIRLANH